MQYVMPIYENPQDFARRAEGDEQPYFGAWRAYYTALVEAGAYVGGSPLHRLKLRRRRGRKMASATFRMGRTQIPKSSLADSSSSNCLRSMRPWIGHHDARQPRRAPWRSGPSPPNSSCASQVSPNSVGSEVRDTHRTIESVARASYGRLIAYLCARTRDVAGAEDALSDALITALATWPRDGIPRNPEGWLLAAARNRIIDRARHERVRAESMPTLELIARESADVAAPDPLPDDRLKLLFVCAHPAIDQDIHTPLMLQTVLGLDATAIARALLVSPAAMSQRLVRAKTKIQQAGIAFDVPEEHELPQRVDAVLNAIYAAYGSGWEDAAGADPRAHDLADEAIWLARVLRERLPEEPEVRGLLALMLHCEARRFARRVEGQFVPLSDQDTQLWIMAMIDEAEQHLAAASRARRVGRFQLEAAIQSVHAERARSGHTDWNAIALFYEQLVRLSPALGALVGRAAAVAEVKGPESSLSLLDAIEPAAVVSYQPYWAVRAHLLKRLDRRKEAARAFDRAIGLAEDAAVRDFLLERRGAIS